MAIDEQTFAKNMKGKTLTDICVFMSCGKVNFEFCIDDRRFLAIVESIGMFGDAYVNLSVDEVKQLIYDGYFIGKFFNMYGTREGSVIEIYVNDKKLIVPIENLYEVSF